MHSQWLKKQFKHNPDKTKASLAKALGLEPPAISKILNGTRQVKAHELAIIKHFFDLSNNDSDSVTIDPHSGAYIYKVEPQPIEHTLRDSRDHHKDKGQWNIPAEVLQAGSLKNAGRNAEIPDDVIIHKNSDSAMEPDFRNGEFVLVTPSDQKPPGIFMISDGYSTVIRRCEHVDDAGKTALKISANSKSFISQVADLDDFEILGRVVGKVLTL